MLLTNREIATVIIVGVILIAAILFWPNRTQVRSSILEILKLLVSPIIVTTFILVCCYASLIIWGSLHVGLWDISFLKDRIIILFGGVIPIIAVGSTSNQIKTSGALVVHVFKSTISISILIAFYMNVSSLHIIAEFFLQVFIIGLVLCQAVLRNEKFNEVVLAIMSGIGIFLLLVSTIHLVETWQDEGLTLIKQLVFSVIFPLAFLPFAYLFALYARAESVANSVGASYAKNITKSNIFGVFIGAKGSLARLTKLQKSYDWKVRLSQADGFRETLKQMKLFRQEIRKTS